MKFQNYAIQSVARVALPLLVRFFLLPVFVPAFFLRTETLPSVTYTTTEVFCPEKRDTFVFVFDFVAISIIFTCFLIVGTRLHLQEFELYNAQRMIVPLLCSECRED